MNYYVKEFFFCEESEAELLKGIVKILYRHNEIRARLEIEISSFQ